jgi:hypothetical protein
MVIVKNIHGLDCEVHWRALARQVLVVASKRIEGTWKAYCDAVPGESHEKEVEKVFLKGIPVEEKVARVLFAEFKDVPYAR